MNKAKLGMYAALAIVAYLVYVQWNRKGQASFGPLVTPTDANPYGDPNAGVLPPNAIGAPGSDAYAGKSLTGMTEAEEWDAMNRLRQTAPAAILIWNPSIPGMKSVVAHTDDNTAFMASPSDAPIGMSY